MLKAAVSHGLRRAGLEQLGVLVGYLRASGWWRSVRSRVPQDAHGAPLPWYSYDFVRFLEPRLALAAGALRVFEYGVGNSTLWWSARAAQVSSVEDDAAWYGRVARSLPDNVRCSLERDADAYVAAAARHGDVFDVIVVDGSHRERCAEVAAASLGECGVLILDNSDWPSLEPAAAALRARGFRQLEFYGLGPCNGHPWGTSVFYRDRNVLGI